MNALRLVPFAPVALVALVACSPPAVQLTDDDYPGVLQDLRELEGDWLARQKIDSSFHGRTQSLEAVLQKRGETLTLVGLAPFGKAFVMEQTADQQSPRFESFVPQQMPFPPRFMLLDVHRALLIGLPGAPLADGEHQGTRHGEVITEVWRDGALIERRFHRADGQPPGVITVRYGDGMRDGVPPRLVTFDNGWFGYQIVIETVEHGPLPGPSGALNAQ